MDLIEYLAEKTAVNVASAPSLPNKGMYVTFYTVTDSLD
jgi:hypothetical protein